MSVPEPKAAFCQVPYEVAKGPERDFAASPRDLGVSSGLVPSFSGT
jgi:hypothetical protein